MSVAKIEFDGIWKKFRRGEVHDSLRDLIPALGRRLLRGAPDAMQLSGKEFWALRDVSFEVEPGETLGIIGSNGAGKSTILKVLTRILRPTRGHYHVEGRVGALIEVAAGFHQDLTGRENVYLQGAIMGMPKSLIESRFDDIVDFSGISAFIDTPVKRYSSGMNARLGFSIAAHLDPDVLIIDEVLAVGDFLFQQHAFDRIRSLARSGIPCVVVSHQLDRIAELCTRVLVLSKGEVIRAGEPGDCIGHYLRLGSQHEVAASESPVLLTHVSLPDGHETISGGDIRLRISGRVQGEVPEHLEPVGIRVRSTQTGQTLFSTSNSRCGLPLVTDGAFVLDAQLQMNVPPGIYIIETCAWDRKREREVLTGPSIMAYVTGGPSFHGTVQLNPRLSWEAARSA